MEIPSAGRQLYIFLISYFIVAFAHSVLSAYLWSFPSAPVLSCLLFLGVNVVHKDYLILLYEERELTLQPSYRKSGLITLCRQSVNCVGTVTCVNCVGTVTCVNCVPSRIRIAYCRMTFSRIIFMAASSACV